MGTGTCMSIAKDALTAALDKLSPRDKFAISAFDHRQIWFDPLFKSHDNRDIHIGEAPAAQIFVASSENIKSAKKWIQELRAQGGTDILSPYSTSCQMLSEGLLGVPFHQWSQAFPQLTAHQNLNLEMVGPGGVVMEGRTNHNNVDSNLPFVILITDGAVPNESVICKYASEFNECLGTVSRSADSPLIRTYTFGIGPYANK
jgi:hypothetical protein